MSEVPLWFRACCTHIIHLPRPSGERGGKMLQRFYRYSRSFLITSKSSSDLLLHKRSKQKNHLTPVLYVGFRLSILFKLTRARQRGARRLAEGWLTSPYSGRDCVKSLWSSYAGLYPQKAGGRGAGREYTLANPETFTRSRGRIWASDVYYVRFCANSLKSGEVSGGRGERGPACTEISPRALDPFFRVPKNILFQIWFGRGATSHLNGFPTPGFVPGVLQIDPL
jgi:hypothetical protein